MGKDLEAARLIHPRPAKAMLSDQDWHARFVQQAGWTRPIRRHLTQRLGLGPGARILEVGSGTGAVSSDLASSTGAAVFGLDIQHAFCAFASREDSASRYLTADALAIPFPSGMFDIAVSHFFMMWMRDPAAALREMRRVVRQGGWLLALAEPDYGGQIHYPKELDKLGRQQALSLERQGANPYLGRQLASLFLDAGLVQVESGLIGGEWQAAPGDADSLDKEWRMIEHDLGAWVAPEVLERYRRIDEAASRHGERILFVPTFYAIGQIPALFPS